mgnify:FL=1|jgi:hypothetical protein
MHEKVTYKEQYTKISFKNRLYIAHIHQSIWKCYAYETNKMLKYRH